MKTQLLYSLVAALLIGWMSAPVQAQDTGGIVAVLDVAKVFDQNADFKAKMDQIKNQAESLKQQIQAKQEKIRTDAAQLQEYEVGSPDRNQLEAALEQRQAALRTEARQAEQDLLNREARIYYDTYKQMQTVVASIAQEYGISLVLRFESDPIDPDNRPEVIKGVNRAVVYHHKLDLTSMVINKMQTTTANAGGAAKR